MDKSFNFLDYPIVFRKPRRLTDVDYWHLHIPFAFAIVAMLEPERFVELGTQKGDSYCAFCQAVEEAGLNTACFAVDSWQGDEHTGNYGEEVLEELKAYHDPLYGGFSRLVKCLFDDALESFAEASIDLLHIDGSHAYESVKHDFESWLPKMSKRGVVLLHDTNVREAPFGVWRLWHEIKGLYPNFEFRFGNGLGVLAVGEHIDNNVQAFLETGKDAGAGLESFFFNLGNIISVSIEKEKILRELNRLRNLIVEKDKELAQRESKLKEADQWLRDKDSNLFNLERLVRVKDQYIRNLEKSVKIKDSCIGNLEASIEDKDIHIGSLETAIREKDVTLNHIYSSRGWKALVIYGKIRDRLLPYGSWRRALVRAMVNFLSSTGRFTGEKKKIKIEDRLIYFIDNDLTKPFIIGPGNALYLRGRCYHTTRKIKQLYVLIDGTPHPVTNFSLPRKDIFLDQYNKFDFKANSMNSGFWVVIPFPKIDSRCKVNLDIRAELKNGEICESHVGSIILEPRVYKDVCDIEILTRLPNEPFVAICMTTYNPSIELFNRQIDSIIQQTHKNWMCIINDDCSNPDFFKQIKDIAMRDSRFKVYQNPSTLGFYDNFEQCLLRVPDKVSFVALADQDDYWHEDKLSVLLSHFDEDAMLVFSDMNIVDEMGEIINNTYWTTRKNNFKELDLLILANTVTGAASIFRRDLLDLILPFPEKIADIYHDQFIACTALATGKIGYVGRPLYDYCQHSDNIIGHKGKSIDEELKLAVKQFKGHTSTSKNINNIIGKCINHIKALLWFYQTIYYHHFPRRVLIANILKLRCNDVSKRKKAIVERFVRLEHSTVWLIFQIIKDKILRKGSITMGIESMLLRSYVAMKVIKIYLRLKRLMEIEGTHGCHQEQKEK